MSEHPLRKWRINNNITLTELASRCGTTAASISRIERGSQQPSMAMLMKIFKATNDEINFWHFMCEWEGNRDQA